MSSEEEKKKLEEFKKIAAQYGFAVKPNPAASTSTPTSQDPKKEEDTKPADTKDQQGGDNSKDKGDDKDKVAKSQPQQQETPKEKPKEEESVKDKGKEKVVVNDEPKGRNKKKGLVEKLREKRSLRHSGFYAKKQVSFSRTYGTNPAASVRIREFGAADACKGALLITSFPSMSLASILAGAYFREQLGLPLIGVVTSAGFPTRCIIEKGIPSHAVRIFGDHRVVVIVCEFKLPTIELTHRMAECILDFLQRHSCPLVVTIEGLPVAAEEVPGGEEEIARTLRFISTNKKFSDRMGELGYTPLEEAVVGGMTGALLAEGCLADTADVACLLAFTSKDYPQANPTTTVVKALLEYYNKVNEEKLELDLAPLDEQAGALTASLRALFQREQQGVDASTSMYS